ncbi:cytochrome P450 [Dactylosporangium sp. AC04546]|uniref:cytochrome P450 n=1 Tax=Dactylosporangium sp. AC04546 TaxID=2862460 RepID=UPI001EDDB05E|nr:cytochrome P450 [Dactylosporangium sp. AC04546]WVK81157.1 cytochrome P450 [Dactylosporangium sp. AC04546]
MSTVQEVAARKAGTVAFHRAVPRLARDPLGALVGFAEQAGGEVVRVNLGAFRPFLVSDPADVQHVLRDNAANYTRDGKGMLWRSVKRLFGEGILAEGQVWAASRNTLQPLFTARKVDALVDGLAASIDESVARLDEPARAGTPVDLGAELSTIVCGAIMRVLFADKVTVPEALRIVNAQNTIATAIVFRLVVPFVPNGVPMPGDRPFRDAVQQIDDILLPIVRAARERGDEGDDIISTLARAVDAQGRPIDERQARNDTVAMFATTTETTFGVLTWLWPILQAHPEVAERLYEEVDRVVGDGPITRAQLGEMTYMKAVLEELLRLYPVGWLIPRVTVADDVVGGTRIPAGADILVSPYITQRLAKVWERPSEFDPERFSAARSERHHRYAHYPFGGGPHVCLGQHLFYLEAQLIVATILRRFRFQVADPAIPEPQVAASLRPKAKVELTLQPRDAAS